MEIEQPILCQLTFETVLTAATQEQIRQLIQAQADLSEALFTETLQSLSIKARLTVLALLAVESSAGAPADAQTRLSEWLLDTLPGEWAEPFAPAGITGQGVG